MHMNGILLQIYFVDFVDPVTSKLFGSYITQDGCVDFSLWKVDQGVILQKWIVYRQTDEPNNQYVQSNMPSLLCKVA